jgi:Rod binding domain-containing protein
MSSSVMGPGAANSQASLLQAQEGQAMQQMNALKGTTDHARIEKGAKEFEAMLLGSWLQQAEQSFASVPGADGDSDNDGTRDQMMSLGTQTLAHAMVSAGGIGIAKMVANAMESQADHAQASAKAIQPDVKSDGKN